MVRLHPFTTVLTASALLGQVTLGHPGESHSAEEIKREMQLHQRANQRLGRALKTCSNSPDFVARQERAAFRRAEIASKLREKRGIETGLRFGKRDEEAMDHWNSISHDHTSDGITLDSTYSELFGGNASCALVSEETIGPYFVAGELIRPDITEGQAGVPMHIEVQFVNVDDCSPVEDIVIDLWHCNATGVYSGVSAVGQAGVDTTWLRGVQITDKEGVASFDTIFPGHYGGRTNHIHVMSTRDAEITTDGLQYEGGIATHIGQFYFDQKLITAVTNVTPYSTNEQQHITNEEDGIAVAAATEDNDIFMDYALLGDSISDGVLAWIIVAINADGDVSDNVAVAATASPITNFPTIAPPSSEPSGGATNTGANTTPTSGADNTVATSSSTGAANRAMPSPFFLQWRL